MAKVRRITKQDAADWEAAKARSVSGKPPMPFTKAPESLKPFLETLDPSQVYIVHVDRFPAVFKRRIFAVPVLLNISIALLLIWRAWTIIPIYLQIISTIVGNESPQSIDATGKTWQQLAWIGTRRGVMFMIDFCLVKIILPWPVSFFAEQPANPVSWRWKIGFRDKEIVVRESRSWGGKELLAGVKTGQDSPFWKTRVLPALDRRFIKDKTGYMMMDKSWDLDFKGMIDAHTLVDSKKVKIVDFEKSVLGYKEGLGWLVWQAFKAEEVDVETESRAKIQELKNRLTAMGKESLFFRWIEIVQYESNQPGDFTADRQQKTLQQVQKAFEDQGVDFDQLVKDVGGLEGTPGMKIQ